MKYSLLIQEVIEQLKSRFKPEILDMCWYSIGKRLSRTRWKRKRNITF